VEKRDRLSESLLFERAAEVQDRLNALAELLRRQTILEAAIHCRCVLVHQHASPRNAERLLLIAHGRVVSVLDAPGATAESILRWIRAHEILIQTLKREQSEIDAAEVMARWLSVKRETVRWVAIPEGAADEDMRDRIEYVLRTPVGPDAVCAKR
jgi:excinuclease UvrABC nuclease subunit